MEGPSERAAVEAAEVSFHNVAAVKTCAHHYSTIGREADQAHVEGLVMEGAETKPVLNGVRPGVAVPVDVGGLQSDRQPVEPSIEPADRAAVQVGTKNRLPEGWGPRARAARTMQVEIQPDGCE